MNIIVKASLILAAAVAVVSIVLYAAGVHHDFMLIQTLFLVLTIGLNVGVVIWALGKTAPESGYLRQLANAAGIGVLGGALIVAASWVLLAVVFPDVLGEMRQGAITYMDAADMPQEQYDRQMESLAGATAWSQSLAGGIGTFVTSVVAGAVFAIFKRKK